MSLILLGHLHPTLRKSERSSSNYFCFSVESRARFNRQKQRKVSLGLSLRKICQIKLFNKNEIDTLWGSELSLTGWRHKNTGYWKGFGSSLGEISTSSSTSEGTLDTAPHVRRHLIIEILSICASWWFLEQLANSW